MTELIPLDDLPAHMRKAAEDVAAIGAAIRHYGGFGPFGEWGDLLAEQTGPMMRHLAAALESMRTGRA